MTDDTTTDTPEQPRTLKVFTCINRRHPTRSCYALIEDTDEMRAKHREWHVSEETDRRARRDAIKARDEEIAKLHAAIGEYKRAVDTYESEVSKVHGEVQRVETPTPAPALQINRDGYTDEETEDEPDEPEEDDWAAPATRPEENPDPADAEDDEGDALATSSLAAFPQHLGTDDASIGLGTRQPWAGR